MKLIPYNNLKIGDYLMSYFNKTNKIILLCKVIGHSEETDFSEDNPKEYQRTVEIFRGSLNGDTDINVVMTEDCVVSNEDIYMLTKEEVLLYVMIEAL